MKNSKQAAELQKKYYEYQMMEEQMKVINEQLQELSNKLTELEYIKISLDEIGKVKKGSEILAPITSGVFIKANLEDNRKLLVNVGNNTVVTKSVAETKGLMDGQIQEVEQIRAQLLEQFSVMSEKSTEIEKELQKLTKDV